MKPLSSLALLGLTAALAFAGAFPTTQALASETRAGVAQTLRLTEYHGTTGMPARYTGFRVEVWGPPGTTFVTMIKRPGDPNLHPFGIGATIPAAGHVVSSVGGGPPQPPAGRVEVWSQADASIRVEMEIY